MNAYNLSKFKAFRTLIYRSYCSNVKQSTEGEQRITSILKNRFPSASFIKVEDVSGGCGSMYNVNVTCEEFKGQRMIKQHKLVNEALKEEIAKMHGIVIDTKAA